MPAARLSRQERDLINRLVAHYETNQGDASKLLEILTVNITADKTLKPYIHSVKARLKDPVHLRDKLERKMREARAAGRTFNVTEDNLFVRINDLAGFRILHLNTRQMQHIHQGLIALFERERYVLRERPFASTWDDESRSYFTQIGIRTRRSPSLYTSVHYVINANSLARATCEIQVRTLMEEVWGEVNHSVNYPHALDSVACTEQIKALARLTSGATRLVDSIFRSYEDHLTSRARLSNLRRRKT
jgi:putative GTP pyrophosphokinase